VDGRRHTLTLSCRRAGSWPKQPVLAFLPHRIDAGSVEITEGATIGPVLTDNFVLLPLTGDFAVGDTVRVAFTAEPAEEGTTGVCSARVL